jgi:hypothetical protein
LLNAIASRPALIARLRLLVASVGCDNGGSLGNISELQPTLATI